jgi:hypothetical protein
VKGVPADPAWQARFEALVAEGDHYLGVANQEAIGCFERALDMLPPPRTQWPEAPGLLLVTGLAYLDTSGPDLAEPYLVEALSCAEGRIREAAQKGLAQCAAARAR